jgi:DNA topoisomerase I
MRLMIVESPTKAKKISSLLGSDWVVKASIGHIVDVPAHVLGVAPKTYALSYEVSERGKSVVDGLAPLVRRADEIFLASDPDREGEAISYHLKNCLNIDRYKRVTFHEITESGIRAALAEPRQIDANLVRAQEARRAMDRLIGFRVSPSLSANAGMNLSAGRCQSPAVRLVVERQMEIDNFKPLDHFSAQVEFGNGAWSAVWNTKRFIGPDEEYVLDQALAERAAACRQFTVSRVDEKLQDRAPPAPFTTSALLQAAGSALKYAPALTQALAQRLFEGGHISYHRTDSPNLSPDDVAPIRAFAEKQGWKVTEKPRHWASSDGAQEAHGAIRPTHVEELEAGESEQEKALYRLIWQRAVASQLEDAQYRVITVDLVSGGEDERFEFCARSSVLMVKGWQVVLPGDVEEGPEKDSDVDQDAESSGDIPALEEGASVSASGGKLLRRATKPPSRFSETSLIRKLEQMGIGRPSTFSAIVTHIGERGFVKVERRFLVPQPAGYALVKSLANRFSFMDYQYTKYLETRLDMIADGKEKYLAVVSEMDGIIDKELTILEQEAPRFPCPACGKALHLINGKRGPFWGCTGYQDGCTIICEDNAGTPGPAVEHSTAPSEKALAFAQRLAGDSKQEIAPETLASAKLLGEWIDEAIKKSPPRMASDKQKALIASMIEKDKIDPPKKGVDKLTLQDASAFIDAHLHKSKSPAH